MTNGFHGSPQQVSKGAKEFQIWLLQVAAEDLQGNWSSRIVF